MGLIITKKADLFKIECSIGGESYHPDKSWVTIDEAKRLLVEKAFYNFMDKALEISMDFPIKYNVNGRMFFDENQQPTYNKWYLEILDDKDAGQIRLVDEFNKRLDDLGLVVDMCEKDKGFDKSEELLRESLIQLRYLSDKFKETGTGNSLISKIEAHIQEIDKWK